MQNFKKIYSVVFEKYPEMSFSGQKVTQKGPEKTIEQNDFFLKIK